MIGSRRFEESIAVSSSCLPQHDLSGFQLPRACSANPQQDRGRLDVYLAPFDNIEGRYLGHAVPTRSSAFTGDSVQVTFIRSTVSSTHSQPSAGRLAALQAGVHRRFAEVLDVPKEERTAGMIRP
jgi:hypothetical protein